MVTLKEAIATAKDYVRGVYADEQLQDIRLEEVDRSSDGEHWLITIGFRGHPNDYINGGMTKTHLFADAWDFVRYPRDYKVVRINVHTGEVASMSNRAA
jgi:hypothetical protein